VLCISFGAFETYTYGQYCVNLLAVGFVAVIWEDYMYVMTISNHKIFIVKRAANVDFPVA